MSSIGTGVKDGSAKAGGLRIIQALPRSMKFEARWATSVELCVAEWVSGSRYRAGTVVFAETGENPLIDIDIHRLRPARRFSSWHLAREIRREAAARSIDLIVTQQHVSTAARIAAFNRTRPVILQTHNFIESPRSGTGAFLANALMRRRLNSLAGITLISEVVKQRFEREWPGVSTPRAVVTNGFDFSAWRADAPKQDWIVVVGRANAEKGIREAAAGIRTFLKSNREWRAKFILSHITLDRPYFASVEALVADSDGRAEILTDIPFRQVKEITEAAKISVVASKWQEPFGRTALEAHAAGLALISSGTGGLREISGDAAAYLDDISGDAISRQLFRLAEDEALRRELAEAGASRVRRLFSLRRTPGLPPGATSVCERLDDFYEAVLHGRRTGRSLSGMETR